MSGVFRLTIRTDNAAFDGNEDEEIARILCEVAERIRSGDVYRTYRNLHDINGNVVGTFALKDK
jgi:hypothetical protein